MVDPSLLPYGSYGILVIVVIIDAKFRPWFHLLSSYPSTAAYNYSENEQNSLFHEISKNLRGKRKFCWIRTSFVFVG